jgi:hypothetical protein
LTNTVIMQSETERWLITEMTTYLRTCSAQEHIPQILSYRTARQFGRGTLHSSNTALGDWLDWIQPFAG